MGFIDEISLHVSSGNGGPGCISFRRESHVPRGGPDGGDGGRGGHVVFRIKNSLNSLVHLKKRNQYKAENGQPGSGRNQSGLDGDDLLIEVPEGTLVKTVSGDLIVDLSGEDEFLFLDGGLGGKGNCFYKSSVNQAPEKAQKGLPGEVREVKLELKLIADVGLLGFPNVGKSTLISVLSAARPKIANYPFTTLAPNLGVVQLNDEASCVIADIPGLIKGASEGVGLGYQFLRHVERTKLLLHMIDVSEYSCREPLQDYKDICYELKKYSDVGVEEGRLPLHERPQFVVFNKVDTITDVRLRELNNEFQAEGISILEISAITKLNLQPLKFKIFELLDKISSNNSEENVHG